MEYRTLGRTGIRVSVLGFGAATLGDIYGTIDEEEGIRAVRHAVDRGITLVDCAPYYGETLAETRLGRALEGIRDRVVLSTKCCRYGMRSFDFSRRSVEESFEASLRRLRTDRIDLLIVHDVEFGDRDQVLGEAIPAVLRLRKQGKIRAAGISGLPLHHLRGLAEAADLDFVLSYCHYNLLADDLPDVLGPLVTGRGMGLVNASPLHMGVLSGDGPPPWHPAGAAVKEAGRRVLDFCRSRGVDASAVSLRKSLDLPCLSATLVGMKTRAQVDANLAVLGAAQDPALLAEIEAVVGDARNRLWPEGLPENNP